MNVRASNENPLDWPRIRHLLKLGIFAALMVLVGDMLLGWGVHDASKSGMEGFLSIYLHLTDSTIFWSAFLGLIGIPLEALCYFAVYRLIKPYSEKYAHLYRSGILGILAFGGCGVHVPCLSCVFFYKYMKNVSPDTALEASVRFGLYFLLPGMILFLIFWVVHHIAHISAFAKRLTPYPKMLDFLPGGRHGADDAAEAPSGNGSAQRYYSGMDQHWQPVDVYRLAGDVPKGGGKRKGRN